MNEVDGFFGPIEKDFTGAGVAGKCEKQFEYQYMLIFFNEYQRLFDEKLKEEHQKSCSPVDDLQNLLKVQK